MKWTLQQMINAMITSEFILLHLRIWCKTFQKVGTDLCPFHLTSRPLVLQFLCRFLRNFFLSPNFQLSPWLYFLSNTNQAKFVTIYFSVIKKVKQLSLHGPPNLLSKKTSNEKSTRN